MKIKANNLFVILTAFYIYFIIALFESTRGNFVPFFMEEFRINNTQMSLIFVFNTMGATIGSFMGGHLCEKHGHKFVFFTGSTISTLSVLIAPFASNLILLGLFNFLFGVGRALLAVTIDSSVPILSIGFESILMNITHFMYGFGSFAGQSIYGNLLGQGFHWRRIYLYLGIFFIISIILTIFIKIPKITTNVNKGEKRKELYKNPIIYLFVVAVAFTFLGEAVLYTWFISYMRTSYGFSPTAAAKYATIYYFLFALGRLVGGFVLNKTGNIKGLQIYLLAGAMCILAGLLLRSNGLIVIAASGFFISIVFPTLMVITNKIFKESSSFAIGLITTIGNILFMILLNITGALNDFAGNYVAFYIAPAAMIGNFIIITIINRKTNKTVT